MKRVLVLGSVNIDFVSFVSRYPQLGETLSIKKAIFYSFPVTLP